LPENKRLTLDESANKPFSWTPNGKAVLFSSDRNGTPEIFKQDTDQAVAEVMVMSAEYLEQPRVTPDGSEILYISHPKSTDPEAPASIFAIPIAGGAPRLILKDVHIWNMQCARLPSTMCLYSKTKGDTSETFRFDVRSGKSSASPQVDPFGNWSLSPDGSQRAIIPGRPNGTIRLRSTLTGETRELSVKGWNELGAIDWSADGRSLLVTWENYERDSALLRITLDGRVSVLLRSSNGIRSSRAVSGRGIFAAIPSPDGKSLAIAGVASNQNVWQVENF
jgi:Tol biopolymer transport system component